MKTAKINNKDKENKLSISFLVSMLAFLCLISGLTGANNVKQTTPFPEHPLGKYLEIESALILEQFPYPRACKNQEKAEFEGLAPCGEAWGRMAKELKKYGLITDTRTLSDGRFWERRDLIVGSSALNRRYVSLNIPDWWDKARRNRTEQANAIYEKQKAALEEFKSQDPNYRGW